MEKRYVLFMVLSMGLMMSYVGLNIWLYPPDLAQQEVEQAGVGDDADQADGKENGKENAKPPEANGDDSKDGGTGENEPSEPPVAEARGEPNVAQNPDDREFFPGDGAITAMGPQNPAAWVTLGSYDGSRGPHALTFSSRGGGLVRWELVERDRKQRLRYRDLDNRGGYLGVGAWTRSPGGCEVQSVIPASPADGKLEVGDEIQKVGGVRIVSIEGMEQTLATHDHGERVEFTVFRRGAVATIPIELGHRPFQLVRPEKTPAGMLMNNPPSFEISVLSVDGEPVDPDNRRLAPFHRLRTDHWKIVRADDQVVEMSYSVPEEAFAALDQDKDAKQGGVEIIKRFRLTPVATAEGEEAKDSNASYHVQFEIHVTNTGADQRELVLKVDGPNGVSSEGWWYQNKMHPKMFKAAGARDVVMKSPKTGRLFRGTGEIFGTAKKRPESPVEPFVAESAPESERTIEFLAVDAQYFAVAMLGPEPGENFVVSSAEPRFLGSVANVDKRRVKTVNATFSFQTLPITTGGDQPQLSYSLFGGPKRSDLLNAYGLDPVLEYGWFWFVAKPLATVLHGLYAVVRNYGLAIILLTVLVRFMMLPFGRKAARNALMMQQLAPEMAKIKEKHKGDMQKQAEAQRELYAKYGFNPLSGCLPMLFQLPIFLGLYRCLSVDINLRQAALIPGVDWCSNLAAPDQFWNWSAYLPDMLASETGWLGPYLNILPIATIALFLVQQKMFTPPPQDEQQEMQQKIMMYMMVFIGVMFFKVPAGLCIYFITSSFWGIMERKLIPKPELKAQPAGGGPSVDAGSLEEPGMEPSKASIVKRERARQRRRDRKN